MLQKPSLSPGDQKSSLPVPRSVDYNIIVLARKKKKWATQTPSHIVCIQFSSVFRPFLVIAHSICFFRRRFSFVSLAKSFYSVFYFYFYLPLAPLSFEISLTAPWSCAFQDAGILDEFVSALSNGSKKLEVEEKVSNGVCIAEVLPRRGLEKLSKPKHKSSVACDAFAFSTRPDTGCSYFAGGGGRIQSSLSLSLNQSSIEILIK